MERTGIGDAELARRIPVNRLTLVRWKEGATSRPRYGSDVVRCAELLRLTREERDELLVSAGFPPETATAPTGSSEDTALASRQPAGPPAVIEFAQAMRPRLPHSHSARRRVYVLAGGLVIALTLGVVAAYMAIGRDTTVYPVAASEETLVVLAPFVNFTAGEQGFNVSGRLREAIENEITEAGLASVRTAEWPQVIADEAEASRAVERSNATLVIWGEYDSGRVIARFTSPGEMTHTQGQRVIDLASSPEQLSGTINVGLRNEVRYVALSTLGQIYLGRGEHDNAKTILFRALDPRPSDASALSNLRYLLGLAYLDGSLADFDESIWLFSQVLAAEPQSVDVLNSRGLAYMERGRIGDADLAVEDLSRAVGIQPDRPASRLNLAVAYMVRATGGDVERAIDILTRVIEDEPDYAAAFVNRAAAAIAIPGGGDLEAAFTDIETALEIDPLLDSAYVNRGNAFIARGSEGDLDRAVEAFTKALELSPSSSLPLFNRGLVHSGMGNIELSIDDLLLAQQLDPREPLYNEAVCRQLAIGGSPDEAIAYCDLAVEAESAGYSMDARGLANALLDRHPDAIEDFHAFLAWVEASPKKSCGEQFNTSRRDWVQELQSANNPFSSDMAYELRARPTLPGTDPC